MRYIPYKELEDAFSERCYPQQAGLDQNQKKFLFSYFQEAYAEVWNKFDWDFTISIEEAEAPASQVIDMDDLDDAANGRILQIFTAHPFLKPQSAKAISFRIAGNEIYLAKDVEGKIYIKYKNQLALMGTEILIPACFKTMLLALCVFHWENGQGRVELGQASLANYERYAQLEISKQSVASIYGNSINARAK